MSNFKDLEGHKIIAVEGFDKDSEKITFICEDGSVFKLYHSQDCCEFVRVDDIVGDIDELINATILSAEESTNNERDESADYPTESSTWTFYKIRTSKGYVDIKWLGESNGYYSESVYFEKIN